MIATIVATGRRNIVQLPRKLILIQKTKNRHIRPLSNIPSPSSSSNNDLTASENTRHSLMTPVDFDTSSSIQGEESQILQVRLKPNQSLRAESGAMLFMTDGVEMDTSLGGKEGEGAGSAISSGINRFLTGQNMFLSDYQYRGKEGTEGIVGLGTDFPSKIIRFSLSEYEGQRIICQKGAYLASSMDVEIQMEFTKTLTGGFFGGEGFILQSLSSPTGDGEVFVKAGGTLVKKELELGETLRISSGSLVAFTHGVEYDVQTMPGFKNVLFGGEGLFVTTLTGPGTVWLQGMPPDRMISEIVRRIPAGSGIGLGVPVVGGGGGGTKDGVEGATEGAEAPIDEGVGDGSEDLVASTDAAVEMDRNTTVASSGFETTESESAASLFGDAAPVDEPAYTGDIGTEESSSPFGDSLPDLDNSTSFSTEDTGFGEDFTNDSQFDNFQQDETSFSSEMGDDDIGGSIDSDEGGGFLSQVWEFLKDMNDD